MLTDKDLSEIVQSWGNEPVQRTIIDLCRDVARAQEAAERERCIAIVHKWHSAYPSEDGTADALEELRA